MTPVWDNEALWQVVEAHASDAPSDFLLHSKLPREEALFVACQLEGRREAKEKWPFALRHPRFVFPPHLNRQQSSSEAAARYKASLLPIGLSVADITGGFGMDDIVLAQGARRVLHLERDARLSAAAAWNAKAVGLEERLECQCVDSVKWLAATREHFDLLYADPARRDGAGRKVASLQDGTPNLLPMLPRLLQVADRVLVKASPMTDIALAVAEMGCVSEVHVVEWRGECKEVLLLCHAAARAMQPTIMATAIGDSGAPQRILAFSVAEERGTTMRLATEMRRYLYEPSPAFMKAGCFKLLASRHNVDKLAPSTHLYTANHLDTTFPGRIFEVQEEVRMKDLRKALPDGRANVLCRNYPLSSAALSAQYRLKDSSRITLVATTLARRRGVWLCRPLPR